MDWTNDAISQLRGLWAEGHSTAEIGRRMGISKNAVVGKAHRLNLSARPSPIRRDGAPLRLGQPRRSPTPAPLPRPEPAKAPAPARSGTPVATAMPGMVRAVPPRPVMQAQPPPPPAMRPIPQAPAPMPAPMTAQMPAPVATAPTAVVRPFPRASQRSCCWPMGEPGTAEFRFCGGEAIPAKPYCADHASIAYVKVRDRREDAA